ncbi:class I adenylate-forming enzyme family protein [Kordiimonas aquimaris]|uniref:class I adenylate-forming enzyme family protein n=1 Tax=Kordiimonas aquimaris TaxID=707591 RepID=UPI0021D05D94|nr:class I adenylate-forming enzyme family protein [Kordiimonas aquimaris]
MTAFDTSAPLLPEILSLHGKWRNNKIAIICGEDQVSWRQFNEATNRLANALINQGISVGCNVGVVMSNSLEMVEVLVGIMKSGACSVPINLSVSNDALTAMLEDADAATIFASEEQRDRLNQYVIDRPNIKIISLSNNYDSFKATGSIENPTLLIEDDAPLNIIYSSGTTGTPKGILHTHKGRRDWAYDLAIALRYHGAARTLFTIGLYSNISWVAMLSTLLAGGTLIVHKAFDPAEALKAIETHKITHFAMVPIQLQRVYEAAQNSTYNLASVSAIMSCGSPLHAQLKANLFKLLGDTVVIELFGLTEGVITTLDPEEAEGRMASVGKPLIGTDIKIIGDNDQEVAIGDTGEIVGSGRIVMPGYLNRPGATKEATWVDPNGKAWLRTGDIGQLDADGYLYIVDRKKDMILSGGQNIYPQDIEALLIGNQAISEVAVVGVPCPKWGETPLAVVVPHETSNLDANEITTWANNKLGKQQRIRATVLTSSLPRNANGKILKRELRKKYESMFNGTI